MTEPLSVLIPHSVLEQIAVHLEHAIDPMVPYHRDHAVMTQSALAVTKREAVAIRQLLKPYTQFATPELTESRE